MLFKISSKKNKIPRNNLIKGVKDLYSKNYKTLMDLSFTLGDVPGCEALELLLEFVAQRVREVVLSPFYE